MVPQWVSIESGHTVTGTPLIVAENGNFVGGNGYGPGSRRVAFLSAIFRCSHSRPSGVASHVFVRSFSRAVRFRAVARLGLACSISVSWVAGLLNGKTLLLAHELSQPQVQHSWRMGADSASGSPGTAPTAPEALPLLLFRQQTLRCWRLIVTF